MRNNIEGVNIRDCVFYNCKTASATQVLSGTYTIPGDSPGMLALDANGAARTVLLPPEELGLQYTITNIAAGAFALTVKEDSNTTTIGTVAQGKTVTFLCMANAAGEPTWYALTGA